MRARWIALLIPAALALGFAHDAEAGGYGNKYGYHAPSQSHGYAYGGYRHHGHAPGFRQHHQVYYTPDYRAGYRGYRHVYRRGYRQGYRPAHPGYRHGYYTDRRHVYSRSHRSYWPPYYRGGITLHFGY